MVNVDGPAISKLEPIIREWLAEYKSLSDVAIASYATNISSKEDVSDALMNFFECFSASRDIQQPVCHQIFEFYRSRHVELKRFTLNIFPSIILHHIVSAYSGESSPSTDALILSVYAMSFTATEDTAELEIPQLGNPSIYHDPMSGILSDQMLNIQSSGRRLYQKPVPPNHQTIIPSNRCQILTQLLSIYHQSISLMRRRSILSMCKLCKCLAAAGFPWQNKFLDDGTMKRRYPLSIDFMVQMLRCLYYSLFNDCYSDSVEAVEAISLRGKKEMIPEVIFLCNAILQSAQDVSTHDQNHGPCPYGLTTINLTPLLTREASRKGGRWAVTAKSIKDHKWRHYNEEICGDLSRSLQNPDLQGGPSKSTQSHDSDDTSKFERHSSTSPSKILKSKLKKSANSSSFEKSKSPAPSTGEKKSKKLVDDQDSQTKVKKSPSQHKDMQRYQSAALQKHPSMDDTSLAAKSKISMATSKSSGDVGKSVTARVPATQGSKDDTSSSTALLDAAEHDVKNDSMESDEKESYPLLPSSEPPSKVNSSIDQTAF